TSTSATAGGSSSASSGAGGSACAGGTGCHPSAPSPWSDPVVLAIGGTCPAGFEVVDTGEVLDAAPSNQCDCACGPAVAACASGLLTYDSDVCVTPGGASGIVNGTCLPTNGAPSLVLSIDASQGCTPTGSTKPPPLVTTKVDVCSAKSPVS